MEGKSEASEAKGWGRRVEVGSRIGVLGKWVLEIVYFGALYGFSVNYIAKARR